MRLGEKADDVGRHFLANAVDVEKPARASLSGSCAISISRRHAASER